MRFRFAVSLRRTEPNSFANFKFALLTVRSHFDIREVKHDVYSKRQTAKIKLFQTVSSDTMLDENILKPDQTVQSFTNDCSGLSV